MKFASIIIAAMISTSAVAGNWANSASNWNNSSANWANSSANWANSAANWSNSQANPSRSNGVYDNSGNSIGYTTPKAGGGFNVYSNTGIRYGYGN